jgi:hypothetical protein
MRPDRTFECWCGTRPGFLSPKKGVGSNFDEIGSDEIGSDPFLMKLDPTPFLQDIPAGTFFNRQRNQPLAARLRIRPSLNQEE